MAVIENDGTISLVNTLFLNLLGYRREDVENRINIFHFSMSTSGIRRRTITGADGPAIQRYLTGTRHRS